MKSTWKTKYSLLIEASDFHNKIRDILISGSFRSVPAYQEVPISDLMLSAEDIQSAGKMRADWYLPTLRIVIEVQGRQHYERVNFGLKPRLESDLDFIAIQNRDLNKKGLLENSSIKVVYIPYTEEDELNESYLLRKLEEFNIE